MRDNVKVDYAGRFYQDFYRAVVHHERRDEWHGLLQTLKAHFIVYLKEVLCETQEGKHSQDSLHCLPQKSLM